jgi:hypothetical protein
MSLPYADMMNVAKDGSPLLLEVAGRALGLGQTERAALANGALPWWFWGTLGVTAGVVVGIQLHMRWPEKIPAFVKGK